MKKILSYSFFSLGLLFYNQHTKANEFPRDYDVGYISVDNVYMMFEPDPHELSIFTGKKKSKLRRR